MPKRVDLQEKIREAEYQKAVALSKRLGDAVPTIYALRGNTAAGKSTALKGDELFEKAINPKTGEPSGAINPDTIKNSIRAQARDAKGRNTMNDEQVYLEGSMLSKRSANDILIHKEKQTKSSMVIDKRLEDVTDIDNILKIAKGTGREVKILDIETPLEMSLIRVLQLLILNT